MDTKWKGKKKLLVTNSLTRVVKSFSFPTEITEELEGTLGGLVVQGPVRELQELLQGSYFAFHSLNIKFPHP